MPTCLEEGYVAYKCEKCDEIENREFKPSYHEAFMMSPDDLWKIVRDEIYHYNKFFDLYITGSGDATCTKAGLMSYNCTFCKGKWSKERGALGHKWPHSDVMTFAMWDKVVVGGVHSAYKVQSKVKWLDDDTMALFYHKWYPITCYANERFDVFCGRNCGTIITLYKDNKTVPPADKAVDHEYYINKVVYEPNATVVHYKCENEIYGCTYDYTVRYTGRLEIIPARPNEKPVECDHKWVFYVDKVAATCTVEGVKIYQCLVCEKTEERKTGFGDHPAGAFTDVPGSYVAATCLADDYWLVKCKFCGKTDTKYGGAGPLGHNIGDKVISVPIDPPNVGAAIAILTPLGYQPVQVIQNCINAGYLEVPCIRCLVYKGKIFVTGQQQPLGHIWLPYDYTGMFIDVDGVQTAIIKCRRVGCTTQGVVVGGEVKPVG